MQRCSKSATIQFSSVTQSCPTLCDPMNHSTPGLSVHYQLLESTQIHVHQVSYAIQPSHPLSSPSPSLNLSQHQGHFKWVSSPYQVAKLLEFQLQHQSFQWIFIGIFRTDFLYDGLVGCPCSPRDSQESSLTPQFKSINSSALSFLYGPTLICWFKGKAQLGNKPKLQSFGHQMWRANSLEKTLMLGKIEGRRRGQQKLKCLDGITNSMDMSLDKPL